MVPLYVWLQFGRPAAATSFLRFCASFANPSATPEATFFVASKPRATILAPLATAFAVSAVVSAVAPAAAAPRPGAAPAAPPTGPVGTATPAAAAVSPAATAAFAAADASFAIWVAVSAVIFSSRTPNIRSELGRLRDELLINKASDRGVVLLKHPPG